MTDPLDVEHERLIAEQKALLREHRVLERNPHDHDGHVEHARKLRAHIQALHAHIEALKARSS